LSETFCTFGAYGDTGKFCLPVEAGAPKPDMPETLYRLVLVTGARGGRLWLLDCWDELESLSCICRAGSDCCAIDGGVREPVEGAVPWLTAPSLEVSVDWSVRKLALERRRSSLNLRKVGAIMIMRLFSGNGRNTKTSELPRQWQRKSPRNCEEPQSSSATAMLTRWREKANTSAGSGSTKCPLSLITRLRSAQSQRIKSG
jgi:hypothetical protein